jgi:hypothetical protein
VAGLDPATCAAGMGLTSPAWSLAHASDQPIFSHARVIVNACMNSAKVIKLPSHCSSSCFQYRNRTKSRKNRVIAALISLRFLFFFYILNMHQLVIQEPRRTSNIPGLEKTKMVMVLCYLLSVSSTSVRFDSSAPPFAFSIFLRSLSYFLRSPTLFPSCFLLNVTSTPSPFSLFPSCFLLNVTSTPSPFSPLSRSFSLLL